MCKMLPPLEWQLGKSSSCTVSIGDIRCQPLEKLLAASTTSSRFKRYGCHEAVWYTDKLMSHEESCPARRSTAPSMATL